MVNIRNKGKDGEYEWINKFQKFFPHKLERNLDQTRYGGSDIQPVDPFCIEIKRVEDCSLSNKNSWWRQVKRAAEVHQIPVVGYRPSRTQWRFLLPANMLTTFDGLSVDTEEWVECSETVFALLVLKVFNDSSLGVDSGEEMC